MQTKKNIGKAIFLLCFVVAFASFKPAVHPFYVSVCDIVIKPKQGEIEISSRIFTDDLQVALLETEGKKTDLSKITKENEALLHAYLKKHLQLRADTNHLNLNWVGYELYEEMIWVYHSARVTKLPKTLEITNTTLMETFEGQSNIVKVTLNDAVQTYKLTEQEKGYSFKL
ncbi:MAG: hypothetical protein FGM41_01255 [Bacteroidetes bacterium]|jgi:hypothetical protein|nr:hypothetical protein [Bacteroidota bacterium]